MRIQCIQKLLYVFKQKVETKYVCDLSFVTYAALPLVLLGSTRTLSEASFSGA